MDFERIITIVSVFGVVAMATSTWYTQWRNGSKKVTDDADAAEAKILDLQKRAIELYEKQIADQKEELLNLRQQSQNHVHEIGELQGQLTGANSRITYLETLIRENPDLVKQMAGIGKIAEMAGPFMLQQQEWMKTQGFKMDQVFEILKQNFTNTGSGVK